MAVTRIYVLASSTVILWVLGLSPIGNVGKGLCLFLSVGCASESIRSSRKAIEDRAEELAVEAMAQELEILELSLATEQREQQLKQAYFPEIYAPEVRQELVNSLEALVQEPSAPESVETSTSTDDRRTLYKTIVALLEAGKSKTHIVEQCFHMTGRNFKKGQELLDSILKQGEAENW